MDHLKESDGSSLGLSAEILIEGVLALEQGEAKRTFASLQKGLEKLVAQSLIPTSAAKQFRQLRAKNIEEKEKKMSKKIYLLFYAWGKKNSAERFSSMEVEEELKKAAASSGPGCFSVDQVRVCCHYCGRQIWAYARAWVAGLTKEANRLGWRLDFKKGLCECAEHRTDVVRDWSFIVNDQLEHTGRDNISRSGWYGHYQRVAGQFALENLPFLFSRAKACEEGWEKAVSGVFSGEEFRESIDILPAGQFVEFRDCLKSSIRPGYDDVVWRRPEKSLS